MENMKVTIILTTYNGEKFIISLLNSLVNQSYLIDEVIISDDCSSDSTVKIIKEFIFERDLHHWKLHTNLKNLGFKKNFLSTMKMATGSIVFLCDQDDIWLENKVEDMVQQFIEHKDMNALICKSNSINEAGKIVVFRNSARGKTRKVSFEKEVRECLGSGHKLAIKREFMMEYIDTVNNFNQTFDVVFCLIAAFYGSLYEVDKILIHRRIHDNNTSGKKKSKICMVKDINRIIEGRKCRLEYFKFMMLVLENESLENEFQEMIEILEKSLVSLNEKRYNNLLIEIFCHNRYINKKITMACIISKFINS